MTSGDRRQIADRMRALSLACKDDWRKRYRVEREADRFSECPWNRRVYRCQKCGHQYGLRARCRSRICPDCAEFLTLDLRKRLTKALLPFFSRRQRSFSVKFVTVTFQSDRFKDGLTRAAFDQAAAHLRQFVIRFFHQWAARRSRHGRWYLTKQWRGSGAIAVPEVGKSGINLHFHMLVYGPYIPQEDLAAAWQDMTTDSRIVDVREVKNPRKAVDYVTKYLSKPPDLTDGQQFVAGWHDRLASWAWLLKGTRRLNCYGIFYGSVPKPDRPDRVDLRCWYDGETLQYAGEAADPKLLLLDWKRWGKDIDFAAGDTIEDWSCRINSPPSADRLFRLDGDLSDWRYYYAETQYSLPALPGEN